jgi:hypothetical protein
LTQIDTDARLIEPSRKVFHDGDGRIWKAPPRCSAIMFLSTVVIGVDQLLVIQSQILLNQFKNSEKEILLSSSRYTLPLHRSTRGVCLIEMRTPI